jgi:putative spermidine/putrescine transport system permease protein
VAVTTGELATERRPSLRRRALAAVYRHRAVQLLLLLTPPGAWFVVIYIGSLLVLFLAAFWTLDPLTSSVVKELSLRNFDQILTDATYRVIALKTLGYALAVTATDIVLALPLAYYMARVAGPRTRAAMIILVLFPLWSSYLVRVYAWRVILQPNGPLDWLASLFGLGPLGVYPSDVAVWIVFSYIWLPFMILPVYAGLERIPGSVLEASADLGARGWTTFRRVVLPLALPAIAAGSIFTFSLTLGDYVTPSLVANSEFIGNVVYDNQGVANNLPFAAAYATVPVLIVAAYLLVVRRLGAFEAL